MTEKIEENVVITRVKPQKVRLARTLGSKQFIDKQFVTLPFEGLFKDCFGEPEDNFSMIIYGESGNGKTEAEVKVCKELTKYGNVYFNSKEQGISRSLQTAWIRNGMHEVDGKVQVAHKEDYEHMIQRLKRKKSAKIVFLDSIQHSKLTYDRWLEMRRIFPKKIFVLISHSEGRKPQGADAKKIEYDVDIKCFVKDFLMYVRSRFGGGASFMIYEKGYKDRMAEKKGKKVKSKK